MRNVTLNSLSPYFQIEEPTTSTMLWDAGIFHTSRFSTKMMNKLGIWEECSRIAPGFYLSIIPASGGSCYAANDQHEQFQELINARENNQRPLKVVCSLVSYMDFARQGVEPPNVWIKKGIEQITIPIPDFTAKIENEVLISVVEHIEQVRGKDHSVLYHCKAGRSRSAMMMSIVLARMELSKISPDKEITKDQIRRSVQTAVEQLQRERKQVGLLKEQFEKAVEVVWEMHLEQKQHRTDNSISQVSRSTDLANDIRQYLASLTIKNVMAFKMISFTMLNVRARKQQGFISNSPEVEKIKHFLDAIWNAQDATWFFQLVNSKDPLYDDFLAELNNHISNVFECTLEQVKAATGQCELAPRYRPLRLSS